MTLDILICTLNARIVRVPDLLMSSQPDIRYVISFQYTDDSYLKMIPLPLTSRQDVTLVKIKGEGLSVNRNNAMAQSSGDLVYLVDDDNRFLPSTIETIKEVFKKNTDVDVVLFKSQTYLGHDLRIYPNQEKDIVKLKDYEQALTCEMIFRRKNVISKNILFNCHFGLGSDCFPCYELQVWLKEALYKKLTIRFFPYTIIQSSKLSLPSRLYIDAGVQCSYGALIACEYDNMAYLKAFNIALKIAIKRMGHFLPILRHFFMGISKYRKIIQQS